MDCKVLTSPFEPEVNIALSILLIETPVDVVPELATISYLFIGSFSTISLISSLPVSKSAGPKRDPKTGRFAKKTP